ncbi:DUF4344 domain-containing metallopeptidase [Streptomyces sp. NPDC096339]|uniref:DUF4344 domain-containing metallopeptidase n=1 Tax=Streptomyces sp. NPDC096339 TaxID=3366086 RepID=UPI0037F1E801
MTARNTHARASAARAARAAATGLATLLLPLALTGCAGQPPTPEFAIRYEEPAPADAAEARFLRDRKLIEPVLADLNAYLALPHRVTVTARSCAGEGTGYDPAERLVELCYDDLTEDRELFDHAGSPHPDEDLAEVVRETIHHEAGHALADALDLALDDRAEEDAADRFAQLMLLRTGRPEGETTLLTAARAYDLAAEADPAPDPSDEHAPPATRAESHRCAVHGAAPARHPDLATPTRAHCATTWAETRSAWTRDLDPLLRR